ncbi:MAG: hypothetical protein HYY24_22940 [Verrucomicrobia bacterium]|nr:hypothetical protein [Verrucomicrobiota bacterium]
MKRFTSALNSALTAGLGLGASLLTWTAQAQTPDQLPPNTFWIEAEDFDYGGGLALPNASVMPYVGSLYDGLGAIFGVDYDSTELAPATLEEYRRGLWPPVFLRAGGAVKRPGGVLLIFNYAISNPSPNHWFNYTRQIPPGLYRIAAAMSHPRSAPNLLRGRLGLVVSGAGTASQVVKELGEFVGPGTGALDRVAMVGLSDAQGRAVAVRLAAEQTTLRFTMDSADFDGLALVPAADPEIVARPATGFTVPSNSRFNIAVTCFETSLAPDSIEFWLDGENLTSAAVITAGPRDARLYYRAPALLPLGPHHYQLKFALDQGAPRQVLYDANFMVYAVQIQPDLLLRGTFDFAFIGDKVYSDTGEGQTKTQELDPGDHTSYLVSLRNRGNALCEFTLKGTPSSDGWTIRYFAGAQEVTDQMVQAGYTPPALLRQDIVDLRVEVSPSATLTESSSKGILVTAISTDDDTKRDAVKIIATVAAPPGSPPGAQFTGASELVQATTLGLVSSPDGTQLLLAEQSSTFPFIWVPNSNEATVSKVDTRTGQELARYRTSPRSDASPSRTTVDLLGNCWVANRVTAAAVKIGLLETGGYIDRNANGVLDTSFDANGDGDITGDELLPWGKDECVLTEIALLPGREATYVPGTPGVPYANNYWDPGTRGLAVDALGNVWLGTFGTQKFYYVEGDTGRILRTIDVSSARHSSYGAVMDIRGVLWSSGFGGNHVLRLDPATGLFKTIDVGHLVYGVGLDRNDHLFAVGLGERKLSRINVLTATLDWTVDGSDGGRGVTVTDDADVWTADSAGTSVSRWSNDGVLKTNILVGFAPSGVAVDHAGKVWVVHLGDESIRRIDPANNTVDLIKNIRGSEHYGYSDMTGLVARNASARIGNWQFVHNSRIPGAQWTAVTWQGAEPAGTSIRVKVRSSDDRLRWSAWETVTNGAQLKTTPPGKYLEVQALLHSSLRTTSPALGALTVVAPIPPTRLEAIAYLAPGEFHFGLLGVESRFYEIQVSTNLIQWRAISTIPGAAGWRTLIDPVARLYPRRFYRAVMKP